MSAEDIIQRLVLNYGREVVYFALAFICFLIAIFITEQRVNARWRRDIKKHLPEIQRQELQERDTEIQRLSERNEQLRADNIVMSTGIRAAASFFGQARESLALPEIMRARAKEETYGNGG